MKISLKELSAGLEVQEIIGSNNLAVEIDNLSTHSKKITPTTLFFAHQGVLSDGRKYIADVLKAGVCAIISDADNFDWTPYRSAQVPILLVANAKATKADISKKFFLPDNPNLLLVGVTGTNGKTSTCWIISQALTAISQPCGYIGTVGLRYYSPSLNKEVFAENNTTSPDVIDLYQFIGAAHQEGINSFAIETSSHSLDQKRLGNIEWSVAVFTNLTQDHLDYHKTLENYAAAKKKLFVEELKNSSQKNKVAVVNVSDSVGQEIVAWCKQDAPEIKCLGYSQHDSNAACTVVDFKFFQDRTELVFNLNGTQVKFNSQLVGDYNVENMLTAASVLAGLGFSGAQIEKGLSAVKPVPGRLERIANDKISVFVDYAHTPDALFRAQDSLRKLTTGKLITLFGCGGDRDRTKRPKMAYEVEKLSDYAVVTSDNPRTEDPEAIIQEILGGFTGTRDNFEYVAITDRHEALKHALTIAKPGDVVLVAGKGHEDYQDVKGVKHHFSDQEECRKILEN